MRSPLPAITLACTAAEVFADRPLAYNLCHIRHAPARNPTMDLVLIESLCVDTVIGVYDWERTITQRLVLDLAMAHDICAAAAGDDVALTLDYAAISERIDAFATAHDFALVETFAERLADTLREEFTIPWLRLTVRKPGAVPAATTVGVQIERGIRTGAA